MKLSVIIPCYNAAETLATQLAALANQDYSGRWEVIVADNGSSDRSVDIVHSFREELPQLRLVSATGRRGAAHARNCGAREARAEFLAFCDADDEVAPDYVRAMIDSLSEHPFVACRYEFKKLNQHWVTGCHSDPQSHQLDGGMLGPFRYAGGGSLGIRQEVHEAIGGFDESLMALEDTDYCIRLQKAGVPLHFAQEVVVHVRWRSTAWECFSQARAWGRGFVAVQQRHWPSAPEPFSSVVRQLLRIRRARSRIELAKWIWMSGWRWGVMEGWKIHRRSGGSVGPPEPSVTAEVDEVLHESAAARKPSRLS